MKGFTRNKKFVPMTDYKKVTRKSRDQKAMTKGVKIRKWNESKTGYYKSLNKQELEEALVLKKQIIAGMDEILKSKFQDKSSEHYREGLRLQEGNKKQLALIEKLLKESRERKKRYIVSYKNVFTKGKWESAVEPYSSLASAEAGAEYLRSKSYPTSRDWTGAKRPRIKTVTKIEAMK